MRGSGSAAWLNISFSAVALGVVGSLTGGVGLVAALLYPIGSLIVILGRSQLYTENTVTPVAVVLTNLGALPNMLRLWMVIFVANVLGALISAATVVYGEVLPAPALQVLFDEVAGKLEHGFWNATLKGLPSGVGWWRPWPGWWPPAGTPSPRRLVIYVLAFLIPAGGLVHCIAGSSEVLVSVFAGEVSFSEYLGAFLLPVTLGNHIGGVFLVALLNYVQVAGSKPGAKTPLSGYTDDSQQKESS